MEPAESETTNTRGEVFLNPDQTAWPHRVIRRGQAVRPLPPHPRPLTDFSFDFGGARVSLDDFMARRRTAGLLILKDGQIALERYALGHGPEHRWASYSVAKSVTATLVGAALHAGAIGSLDDPCEGYLPQLLGSAYDGVTLRNALRMCSGAAWNEEEGGDDLRRLRRALATRRPGSILELAASLSSAHAPGAVFNYSTVESGVLGAVVAAATGRSLADWCAETVWGSAGMEADGYWGLEAEGGAELGGAGVSARLRDYGRFGLFMLEDGVAADGQRRLPQGWRDLAGLPDSPATAYGALAPESPAGYGYHWWAPPRSPANLDGRACTALGAYGQRILVNPADQVVIVIQSAWRQSADLEAEMETVSLFRALVPAVCAAAAGA